jgi:uncharacterized membrane protein
MIRKFAWGTMTVLGILVALYSGAALISPAFRNPFVAQLFANVPFAFGAHLAGGLVAITTGALQVNSRIRNRYRNFHRRLGQVYVTAVAVGGIAGLMLAPNSDGGLAAHFGFGFLAACWLFSTMNAFKHGHDGDIALHRAWMLRSYALTLAAVTLRLYLPAFAIAGYDFELSYPLIAWICWVPNLLVVEWLVLARQRGPAAAANA